MGETMRMFITVGKFPEDPVVFTYVPGLFKYAASGYRDVEVAQWLQRFWVSKDEKFYKTALGACRRSVKLGKIAVEVDK